MLPSIYSSIQIVVKEYLYDRLHTVAIITVKILKFGTPQTIAIIVLKLVKFDVTLH